MNDRTVAMVYGCGKVGGGFQENAKMALNNDPLFLRMQDVHG